MELELDITVLFTHLVLTIRIFCLRLFLAYRKRDLKKMQRANTTLTVTANDTIIF